MKYDHYHTFLTGYWRCEGADYTFDYYIREDGFHIGAVPENPANPVRLLPIALWMNVETAGEIVITPANNKNSWVRDYYRDGNRLVMAKHGDPKSRSICTHNNERDISPTAKALFETFLTKHPMQSLL